MARKRQPASAARETMRAARRECSSHAFRNVKSEAPTRTQHAQYIVRHAVLRLRAKIAYGRV